ncbi:MAG: cell division protein ZapA [Planktomarina sp.]
MVACQTGEEGFLESAAALLDHEASTLVRQIGKLPENRTLLMAGLMLADRAGAADDKGDAHNTLVQSMQSRIDTLEAALAEAEARPVETVEVAVVPDEVGQGMASAAAKAEELADRLEGKLTPDGTTA